MVIGDVKIPEKALNIFNDLKDKITVNLSIRTGAGNYVTNITKNSYLIELNVKENEDANDLGFRLVHEMCHIYQFENGYPKISKSLIHDPKVKDLLLHINDFILDTDIHQFLIDKYNYDIRNHVSLPGNKYIAYQKMFHNFAGEFSEVGEKMIAIELAYIYFNDSKEHAIELNDFLKIHSDNISYYFESILQEYRNGVITSAEFVKEKMINICHILNLDNAYLLN